MLGRGFEETGFCVVRGPDLITGGDIRRFHPAPGRFDGIIAGSPCQDFSRLNPNPGTYGYEMQDQFCRVVAASQVDWFLYENVVTAPDIDIPGYVQQRFNLDLAWFSEFSRSRDFVFGSKSGVLLNPMVSRKSGPVRGTAVTGSDNRSFQSCCEIQGLPADFDLPFFSLAGKKQAVANGVALPMARYLAQLIAETLYGAAPAEIPESEPIRRCKCGCGRPVTGRAQTASDNCRQHYSRASRARKQQACGTVEQAE